MAVKIITSFGIALTLAAISYWVGRVSSLEERLDNLEDRSARSEAAEFYIKDAVDRIEAKIDALDGVDEGRAAELEAEIGRIWVYLEQLSSGGR